MSTQLLKDPSNYCIHSNIFRNYKTKKLKRRRPAQIILTVQMFDSVEIYNFLDDYVCDEIIQLLNASLKIDSQTCTCNKNLKKITISNDKYFDMIEKKLSQIQCDNYRFDLIRDEIEVTFNTEDRHSENHDSRICESNELLPGSLLVFLNDSTKQKIGKSILFRNSIKQNNATTFSSACTLKANIVIKLVTNNIEYVTVKFKNDRRFFVINIDKLKLNTFLRSAYDFNVSIGKTAPREIMLDDSQSCCSTYEEFIDIYNCIESGKIRIDIENQINVIKKKLDYMQIFPASIFDDSFSNIIDNINAILDKNNKIHDFINEKCDYLIVDDIKTYESIGKYKHTVTDKIFETFSIKHKDLTGGNNYYSTYRNKKHHFVVIDNKLLPCQSKYDMSKTNVMHVLCEYIFTEFIFFDTSVTKIKELFDVKKNDVNALADLLSIYCDDLGYHYTRRIDSPEIKHEFEKSNNNWNISDICVANIKVVCDNVSIVNFDDIDDDCDYIRLTYAQDEVCKINQIIKDNINIPIEILIKNINYIKYLYGEVGEYSDHDLKTCLPLFVDHLTKKILIGDLLTDYYKIFISYNNNEQYKKVCDILLYNSHSILTGKELKKVELEKCYSTAYHETVITHLTCCFVRV